MTSPAYTKYDSLVLYALPPAQLTDAQLSAGQRTGVRVPRYRAPLLKRELRDLAQDVQPGWIRIQPFFVGVCGSDLHLLETDGSHQETRFSAPLLIKQDGRIIGHEGIARVLEIGSDTEGFEVGDWVVPSSIYHCGQCQPCRSGSPNQCDKATLLGAQVNGLFASIADIQVELLVNVTNHVRGIKDLIALATLEPASTALQACEMAGLSATSRVVIFGAGPIGAYCAMVAKNVFQCAFVAVVEPIEKRRNLVGPWADITCADLSDLLADLPWAQNLDAVIETSGHLDNINEVFTEVGANGRIVVLARSGEALHLNHVDHMITKAIKIQGCRGQLGGYMARVAELYSRGVLPLDLLVSLCGEGIDFLQKLLLEPDFVRNHNCKSMVRLNEAVPIEGLHN